VASVASLKPDVAELDIGMPNLNGIEAAKQITDGESGAAVVILSMHADETCLLRALKAGARGYLLKDSAESDLVRAIRSVAEGKSLFSPAVSKVFLEDYVPGTFSSALRIPSEVFFELRLESAHQFALR
jgi:two-component system response regulator NreC